MNASVGERRSPLLRKGTPADAPALGEICYRAFRAIAEAHGYPPDFPSAEVATSLLGGLLANPGFFSVVAEGNGRPVGSNFLDERNRVFGVGPITVSPEAQNRGIGRELMLAVLQRTDDQGALGSRLVQAGYHMRSLVLYTKLGYDSRETLACLQGPIVRTPILERVVRPGTEADASACSELCTRVLGFDRSGELKDSIRSGSAKVVESDGRITGYATSVAFFGHQVGESNLDLQALIMAATEIAGPGILVPIRNAKMIRWALTNGLRVVQTMTLMSTGTYQEPHGAYVASIFY